MQKVSVVVPIYNAEKYLNKCLDSIKSQTLNELQVILVNDGSTDNSEKIIDSYVNKYPHIFEKINKKNGGQAIARNCALENVIGEYIIFIDSDDYIEPKMLKEMYENAKNNDSDIVICDYYEVFGNKKIEKTAMKNFSENINVNYILSNASPWNKLIKTKIIKENHIRFLEKHIYEDLATMPILGGYAKNISYIQKPLYDYIIREGSTMRQSTYNKKLDSIFIAINHLEEEFRKRKIFENYKEEIEFLNIYHLLYAASGRFLEYKEGKKKLIEIRKIMKKNYPNWRKNKYYKKQSLQIKITSNIFYYNIFIGLYKYIRQIAKKSI